MSTVATITIAHGRHRHLLNQGRTLRQGTRVPEHRVVVAMDDPALEAPGAHVVQLGRGPGGLPLAAARNLGAARGRELGADVLVFLDVDCLAGRRLVEDYEAAVTDEPEVVWSGPVTYLPPPSPLGYDLSALDRVDDPHPGRPAPGPGQRLPNPRPELFWSLSFALSRDTWSRIGGFCEDYVGYGGEDTDFGRLVVARGSRHGWVGGARAYHQHHDIESPPVRHLDAILRNAAIFHRRWGEWPMTTWLHDFEDLGLVECVDGHWQRVAST